MEKLFEEILNITKIQTEIKSLETFCGELYADMTRDLEKYNWKILDGHYTAYGIEATIEDIEDTRSQQYIVSIRPKREVKENDK